MSNIYREDDDLITKKAKGEHMKENDFAIQAEQIRKQLYQMAFLYLRREADALEAVDEAVYRGFRSCRKLKESAFFKTWMTRIVINICNNELRRKQRVVIMSDIPEQEYQEYDSLPLKEAIEKLPIELRDIIILRYFTGLTLAETADVLVIPRGTVTSRQKRALELLKLDFLEEE